MQWTWQNTPKIHWYLNGQIKLKITLFSCYSSNFNQAIRNELNGVNESENMIAIMVDPTWLPDDLVALNYFSY